MTRRFHFHTIHLSRVPLRAFLPALVCWAAACLLLGCGHAEGERLAKKHCASCHLFPQPDLLPRASWDHVLDYMGLYLGQNDRPGAHPDIAKLRVDLRRENLLPAAPALPGADFDRIREYYRARSSAKLATQTPVLSVGPTFLKPRRTSVYREHPSVTFLAVRPERRRVLAADGLSRTLFELTPEGRIAAEHRLPGPPSGAVFQGDSVDFSLLYLADPRPLNEAAIVRWRVGRSEIVARALPRLAHLAAADFDGDGASDHVASAFGLFRGGLFVRAGVTGKLFELDAEPGWIRTQPIDWNGDGVLDLLVLRAQAREGLYWIDGRELTAFLRRPHRGLERSGMRGQTSPRLRPLLTEHPAFGFTSFELVARSPAQPTLLLLVNGDNGDLPDAPLKPYHGIRIYSVETPAVGASAEGPALRLRSFLPLPGAYRAVAQDFDGDGDLDIAAIAFYPDWSASRPAGFVYYENTGGFEFRPLAPEETRFGRWITMEAGDFDGDGDVDLVLGSYVHPSLPAPPAALELLRRRGHTVLFLENTRKGATAAVSPFSP